MKYYRYVDQFEKDLIEQNGMVIPERKDEEIDIQRPIYITPDFYTSAKEAQQRLAIKPQTEIRFRVEFEEMDIQGLRNPLEGFSVVEEAFGLWGGGLEATVAGPIRVSAIFTLEE